MINDDALIDNDKSAGWKSKKDAQCKRTVNCICARAIPQRSTMATQQLQLRTCERWREAMLPETEVRSAQSARICRLPWLPSAFGCLWLSAVCASTYLSKQESNVRWADARLRPPSQDSSPPYQP